MSVNYPIKFEPILKDKIWGGEKLKALFNKKSTRNDIGESWEVSDVDGNISIVSNGSLKDQSLKSLLSTYKSELVGEIVYKKFGNNFPLLIKFIDAKEALSIQVHPNDTLANERHNSFGKTEMWYVMQAEAEGDLIVGFNKDTSKEEYVKCLEEKKLFEILNQEKVQQGDVYFIPTGRIHAIGAGVLLAEIKQTSDITYRVYDWDRLDDEGNSREFHTELALDAINYSAEKEYKTTYKKELNNRSPMVNCEYFTTNTIVVNGEEITRNYLLHSDIVNGGEIKFYMGKKPNKNRSALENKIANVKSDKNLKFKLDLVNQDPSLDKEILTTLEKTFYEAYPKMVTKYNPNSPKNIRATIDTTYSAVAYASNGEITISAEWLRKKPKDTDLLVHELMHLVQDYNGNGIGWLTEGIADYVRDEFGVNNKASGWKLLSYAKGHKYTDAYKTTASFLRWTSQKHDELIVAKLDLNLRNGTYSEELWKNYTGLSLPDLWSVYSEE